MGLGTRHLAGASISSSTSTIAVVVSESSIIRIFTDGELIAEIIPELWMLSHHKIRFSGSRRGATTGP